jgi:hypothetical protein
VTAMPTTGGPLASAWAAFATSVAAYQYGDGVARISNWRAARVCQIEDTEAKSAEMTVNIGWKDYRKAGANPTTFTGSRFLVGAGGSPSAVLALYAITSSTSSEGRNAFAPAAKRTSKSDSHGGRNIGETQGFDASSARRTVNVDPNFSTMVVSKDQNQNPDRGRRLRQEQALDLNPSIAPTFPCPSVSRGSTWCPATCR